MLKRLVSSLSVSVAGNEKRRNATVISTWCPEDSSTSTDVHMYGKKRPLIEHIAPVEKVPKERLPFFHSSNRRQTAFLFRVSQGGVRLLDDEKHHEEKHSTKAELACYDDGGNCLPVCLRPCTVPVCIFSDNKRRICKSSGLATWTGFTFRVTVVKKYSHGVPRTHALRHSCPSIAVLLSQINFCYMKLVVQ
jgi:hypothetical protein